MKWKNHCFCGHITVTDSWAEKCESCGKTSFASRSKGKDGRRVPGRTWPMKSDAYGVHPSQIDAAIKRDTEMGVNIDYDRKTGQAIFEGPTKRKTYVEARGGYSPNAGYSDPVPKYR